MVCEYIRCSLGTALFVGRYPLLLFKCSHSHIRKFIFGRVRRKKENNQ